MKRALAVGLAALALGACSRSEAQEAADASGWPGVERPERASSSADLGGHEVEMLREAAAAAGMDFPGDPVPCDRRVRPVRPGDDWVTETLEENGMAVTVTTPRTWSIQSDDWGGGPVIWSNRPGEGDVMTVLTVAGGAEGFPEVPADLMLSTMGMAFESVDLVERIDDRGCLFVGTQAGQQMAALVRLDDLGVPITMMAIPLPGASPASLDEALDVLRLVEVESL